MTDVIIGNACTLGAMVTDSLSSTRKTARGVLLVQILSQFFFGASAIVLGGYTAAVQNGISVLRNLVAIRKKQCKWIEIVLIILAVGLGVAAHMLNPELKFFGWLPIVANLEYSLAVLWFKNNERALKIAFLINTILFVGFNARIKNIVAVIANIVIIITTVIFLIKDRKEKADG